MIVFQYINVLLAEYARKTIEKKSVKGMKKNTVKKVLAASLCLFLIGLLVASVVATNSGKTEMRRLSVMTDRGVAISLEVYDVWRRTPVTSDNMK